MRKKFIRCEFCSIQIPTEICQLAAYTTVIDGIEYTFCCKSCAKRYKQKVSAKSRQLT